jgi:RNA polymerase sigma-70 factor (sigma-E family)
MGENEAFERFVRANTTTLFQTSFLLTGNRHEAEELLQDTLTRLFPRWSAVMAADSPVAYVRRCLANRYVSVKRGPAARLRSDWEIPDRWDGADLEESIAVSSTVWQLLAALPDRQRAALVMRYFDDVPEVDVAEALGCRPSSVRSLVSRGLAAMRSAYFAAPSNSAEGSR